MVKYLQHTSKIQLDTDSGINNDQSRLWENILPIMLLFSV